MRLRFLIIIVILILLFVADIALGSMNINYNELSDSDSLSHRLVFDFRLPKAITALVAGVALAISGLMMQTIFRNPLAGPYILGVSSGASLGVAFFMLGAPLLGLGFVNDFGVALSAWIGAAAILLIVMVVTSRLRNIMTVLILGMMFGSAVSAFVDLLQYFSSDSALKGFVIWSMGSVGGLSGGQMWILIASTVVGVVMSVWAIKPLNLLLLGENYARSMGLKVITTRVVVFGATSLLAGGVTAFCGPIAFLGTAVPHIARMIFRRADHRILLPASALLGAATMLLCDIISGLPTSELVLPINTITSLIGIPIVIMIVWQGNMKN